MEFMSDFHLLTKISLLEERVMEGLETANIEPELVLPPMIFLVVLFFASVMIGRGSTNLHKRFVLRSLLFFQRKNRENRIMFNLERYYNVYFKRMGLFELMWPVIFVGVIAFMIYNHMLFAATIISNSMWPTFEKGDMVVFHNIFAEPEVGDILFFDSRIYPNAIVHRCIEIREGRGVRTKGDNPAIIVDPWFLEDDQILGEAVTWHGEPIVLKGMGNYFLFEENVHEGYKANTFTIFAQTLNFMRNFGMVIFLAAIFMYFIYSR